MHPNVNRAESNAINDNIKRARIRAGTRRSLMIGRSRVPVADRDADEKLSSLRNRDPHMYL